MERLAPPTLQVNTSRQRALSNGDTITLSSSDPFRTPVSPLPDVLPSNASETALLPDLGTEKDFQVDNNPFAFTPGQLNKLFNPKSLPAFRALGGLEGIARGLQSDTHSGLSVDEAAAPQQITFHALNYTRTDNKTERHQNSSNSSKNRTTTRAGKISLGNRKMRRAIGLLKSSKKSTIKVLPGTLAGHLNIAALGDTAADLNFIDEDYAASQAQFVIDRSQTQPFTLPNGNSMMTTGTVETTFQFSGEKEVHTLLFHLFPKCTHRVILGYTFLDITETLTSGLKRFVTHTINKIKAHSFCCIGGSGPKFKGRVNGDLQYALADTGAKLLMMDEDYAQKLGLTVETGLQHRNRVQFADQTTAMTSGMVYGVSWQYGDAEGETHMLDFHILKNSPANVVLSEDFLLGDNTSAFADYACYMVQKKNDGVAGCFAIDIDYSYVNPAVDTRDYRDQFESVRYGEEEDWVDSLSGAEKAAAQAAVQLRRSQWDPTQSLPGANAMIVVPPQFRRANGPPTTLWKRLKFRFRARTSSA